MSQTAPASRHVFSKYSMKACVYTLKQYFADIKQRNSTNVHLQVLQVESDFPMKLRVDAALNSSGLLMITARLHGLPRTTDAALTQSLTQTFNCETFGASFILIPSVCSCLSVYLNVDPMCLGPSVRLDVSALMLS